MPKSNNNNSNGVKKNNNRRNNSHRNYGKKYEDVRAKNSRPLGNNTNDISWYYPDESIKRLSTAVNFNNINGNPIGYADGVNLKNSQYNGMLCNKMPGIMRIDHIPVPGVSTGPTSSINQVAYTLYKKIRQEVSLSTLHFEAPDLMNYLYAVSSVYSWLGYLRRLYRTVLKYNPLNNYTPESLVKVMGVNPSEFTYLGNNLHLYIDYITRRISKLYLPGNINWVKKMVEEYTHIFVDEDIAKAQYIVVVPHHLWKFEYDSSVGKGRVVTMYIQTNQPGSMTFENLREITENLLNPIFADEDFGTISGYLSRTFGGNENAYNIESWDDSPIQFEYSKEFLEKMHNMCVGGSNLNSWANFEITQETDAFLNPYLKFNPTYTPTGVFQKSSAKRCCGNRILDFYDAEISSDQILSASRWMFSLKDVDGEGNSYQFDSLGADFIPDITLFWFDNQTNDLVYQSYDTTLPMKFSAGTTIVMEDITFFKGYMAMTKWNYAPIVVVLDEEYNFIGLLGDFGNYTILSRDQLYKLNSCAIEGLFNPNQLV